ncbi:MAG: amidohydrolase family protein, partial [Xenococcus sp. MO_188.B8]|nr:amidohydrolase family protein [Xenococcus sp. MO_188.B8]
RLLRISSFGSQHLDWADPKNPSEITPPIREAITVEECIYLATMGGAYQARMEDKLGSLEVGKYADLVILDRNIFEIDPQELSEVKVLGTVMDGNFTHRDGI